MRTQFSKLALTAGISLVMAFTFSCSSGGNDDGGGSSSPSGGGSGINGGSDKGNDISKYKTTQIGNQVWMAENLNYNVSGSKCGGNDNRLYDENTINCDKYGRLYDWAAAKTACPSGWHLPSYADWGTPIGLVGADAIALKAKSGWDRDKDGTDDYGFSALPGGSGSYYNGYFGSVGERGTWWTDTERNLSKARCYKMSSGDIVVRDDDCYKDDFYSVRCIQD
jgi:uncharacterized protein (TIGR02145 family)